ncbi:MAG: hypothetical protein KJO21_09125 [Verrucomicrobiae bacterium]|nr:hypothetical protein [Verrucomicrobiae bacterium]NNJ43639.1 hypothetical protein [Akkermansiaceae bacterium]
MALVTLPVIIAYYFCRDYPGKDNGPENAPLAACVVALVWTPLYLGVRDLFSEHQHKLNAGLLVIFVLLALQVTIGNPKF